MALSLKLRLKRDLSSRSIASSSGSVDTRVPRSDQSPSQNKAVSVTQGVPRRLTRALARKLQELGSSKSVDLWEISPVLGSTTPQVKLEEATRSDTSSLSPPCLTASIQPAVKEEQLEEISASPRPRKDIAVLLSLSDPTRIGRACAVCGSSAVADTNQLPNRDQSRKSLCDSCLVAFTEQETAEQIYEHNQRAKDDAILLPPPAKHKVANPILESFKGADMCFLENKRDCSNFLPPLQLHQPRINFSSYRHLPPRNNRSVAALVKHRASSAHPVERRHIPSRIFTRSPGGPQRRYPLRRENVHDPYSLGRQITARADTPLAVRRCSSPFHASTQGSPHARVMTLQDIRRRRTILLDFREVALDMLEETSTVLNQLDKTLPKFAALRKEASRCD